MCFTINREARGRGIASALLDSAVAYAFAHGASFIEAYPHVSAGRDYMGPLDLYHKAGFQRVRDANKRVIIS